jgi:hypothetical protein
MRAGEVTHRVPNFQGRHKGPFVENVRVFCELHKKRDVAVVDMSIPVRRRMVIVIIITFVTIIVIIIFFFITTIVRRKQLGGPLVFSCRTGSHANVHPEWLLTIRGLGLGLRSIYTRHRVTLCVDHCGSLSCVPSYRRGIDGSCMQAIRMVAGDEGVAMVSDDGEL